MPTQQKTVQDSVVISILLHPEGLDQSLAASRKPPLLLVSDVLPHVKRRCQLIFSSYPLF